MPQAFTRTTLSARDISVVAVCYLASFLIVAGFPHILMAFPLDDSWIHQVVARNFAHYGKLGFIPNAWSSGSSSLLWTLILAINWKFLPFLNPVAYCAILNVLFLIAMGLGLLAMARKDGLPESSCWIWALTPALNGNFMWLGLLGMEHVLFVTLSVLGIFFWFQSGPRSALYATLCLGLLSLTRPEGLALTGLLILAARWTRRTRRETTVLVASVAACTALFLGANFLTSHSWLPATYAGRKLGYFGSTGVSMGNRVMFAFELSNRLLKPWNLLSPLLVTTGVLCVLGLILLGLFRLLKERRLRTGILCLWSFCLIGIYAVMLPTCSHGGRYQPVFLALNFPLMFLGIEAILRRSLQFSNRGRSLKMIRAATMLAICLLCGSFSLRFWRQITNDGIVVIESIHGNMGRLVAQSIPGNTLAAFDIGRIGYINGAQLTDLGGLVDHSSVSFLQPSKIMGYLASRNISYLIWPSLPDGASAVPYILDFTPEMRQRMKPLATFCAPHDVWSVSFSATSVTEPCEILYRIKN